MDNKLLEIWTYFKNCCYLLSKEPTQVAHFVPEKPMPLANLVRWRDKPVALSIIQARLVEVINHC
jgi:hypothetical protein